MRFAQRANIILLAAQGMQDIEIAEQPGTSRQRSARWRERFLRCGIDGLKKDAARPGSTGWKDSSETSLRSASGPVDLAFGNPFRFAQVSRPGSLRYAFGIRAGVKQAGQLPGPIPFSSILPMRWT